MAIYSQKNQQIQYNAMGPMGPLEDRNPDATIYVGSLEPRVTEELLWELFI